MNKAIMTAMGYGKEMEAVEASVCPFCGKPVKLDELKDEASKREFQISGLCQKCQDDFFGEGC